jgi:predicted nucleotidyltransferase
MSRPGVVIDARLSEIARTQPYPLLFATVSGAHLYGFPSPDSDWDLRGVHVLPPTEILGFREGPDTLTVEEKREDLELDLVTHDVKKFFGLLLRRNGYVLEQLFSPLVVLTTPEHAELKGIAGGCVTRHHNHHYLGFAQTQWDLFIKESPRRVKPLLYVYRVLLTGIHLMRTGEIEANIVRLNEEAKLPQIPVLVARKLAGPEKRRSTTPMSRSTKARWRACDRPSKRRGSPARSRKSQPPERRCTISSCASASAETARGLVGK